jgi:hypothetical protein
MRMARDNREGVIARCKYMLTLSHPVPEEEEPYLLEVLSELQVRRNIAISLYHSYLSQC